MPDRMDELKGSVKETTGKVLGNERMETEGKAEKNVAKAKRKTKGAAEEVKGNVKMAAGKATGDERLHREGQMEDVKGRTRRAG